jgi:hypothetical protein
VRTQVTIGRDNLVRAPHQAHLAIRRSTVERDVDSLATQWAPLVSGAVDAEVLLSPRAISTCSVSSRG